MSIVIGFILATLSAFFNGSFASFSKLEQVRRHNPTEVEFNLYMSFGVFASSILSICIIPFTEKDVGICYQGAVAGVFLSLATFFSFLAVPKVGVSVAQGVWGAASVVVSFLWGICGPSEIAGDVNNLWLSILAVFVIVCGTVGIIYSLRISREAEERGIWNVDSYNLLTGVVYALCTGVAGGSVLVPLAFAPENLQEIAFLPSFGIGNLIACIIIYFVFSSKDAQPFEYEEINEEATMGCFGLKWSSAVYYGMASGIVWNLGNICSIYAMKSGLAYGVAYPILQCALVFSGIWGIIVFKEINTQRSILAFSISAVIVVIGIFLLSIYGPQK